MSGCRIFIGRLSPSAREKDVERFFKGYGRIRDIDLKKGFGFVVSSFIVCFIVWRTFINVFVLGFCSLYQATSFIMCIKDCSLIFEEKMRYLDRSFVSHFCQILFWVSPQRFHGHVKIVFLCWFSGVWWPQRCWGCCLRAWRKRVV